MFSMRQPIYEAIRSFFLWTTVMTRQAAFLFDMDGLLLDTERLFQRAFSDAMTAAGVASDQDDLFFTTLVGSSRKMTKDALHDYLPGHVDRVTFENAWEHAAKQRLAQGVPVKKTVRDVLGALHGQGARMAVVTSSSSAHAHENLDRAGLLGFFEHITGGDVVSANKPDPAPYLETAARLGVEPTDCAAFEDSDKGLTAAIRAGCRAVQVPDLRPPNTPFPDFGQHVADDLAAALRHLGVL